MDPNFGFVYTYLGHYYRVVAKDLDRAEKCYLRALTCYSLDSEAGYSLSKLYLDRGLDDKANNLWENIINTTISHSFWSLNMKAHQAMKQNNLDVAISTFQV